MSKPQKPGGLDREAAALLGLLAVMLLSPDELKADATKPHHHKCPREECGHVWSHTRAQVDADDADDAWEKAHTCPSCGIGQVSRKCKPDGAPL